MRNIRSYNEFISEGVRDEMKPVSKEQFKIATDNFISKIRRANQLKNVLTDFVIHGEIISEDEIALSAYEELEELGFEYDFNDQSITPLNLEDEEVRDIWYDSWNYDMDEFPDDYDRDRFEEMDELNGKMD